MKHEAGDSYLINCQMSITNKIPFLTVTLILFTLYTYVYITAVILNWHPQRTSELKHHLTANVLF